MPKIPKNKKWCRSLGCSREVTGKLPSTSHCDKCINEYNARAFQASKPLPGITLSALAIGRLAFHVQEAIRNHPDHSIMPEGQKEPWEVELEQRVDNDNEISMSYHDIEYELIVEHLIDYYCTPTIDSKAKPINLDSNEFTISPLAEQNSTSWDRALKGPDTHDKHGERIG